MGNTRPTSHYFGPPWILVYYRHAFLFYNFWEKLKREKRERIPQDLHLLNNPIEKCFFSQIAPTVCGVFQLCPDLSDGSSYLKSVFNLITIANGREAIAIGFNPPHKMLCQSCTLCCYFDSQLVDLLFIKQSYCHNCLLVNLSWLPFSSFTIYV